MSLPLGLIAGFLWLIGVLFGDKLIPAPGVEVIPVATLEASFDSTSGPRNTGGTPADRYAAAPLFQASGWIEADPYPYRAVTLVDGVVEAVHVLEGESVKKGQVLATLIREDAELALAEAQARLGQKTAQLALTEKEAAAAAAALRGWSHQVTAAEARLQELRVESERFSQIGKNAMSEIRIRQSQLRTESQLAEVEAIRARLEEWEKRAEARQASVVLARQTVHQARVQLDQAELALERTQIRSPIDGVVQVLHASPGKKKILRMDDPESATIAVLFKPGHLQARIDVPLEQAAQLQLDQPAWIRTNLLPDLKMKGRVTRIEGQADLQRNTLQAKVAIHDPHPRLRPEMLCRAEFLPLAGNHSGSDQTENQNTRGNLRLYVPESSLVETARDTARVWAVRLSDNRLDLRDIRLGPNERDDHREVIEGLRPGERIVLNPTNALSEGQRVRPLLN